MKTPKFWDKKCFVSNILIPISWIYGAVTQLRIKLKKPYKCGAKVICIGNITAGGVGKTPVAIAMAKRYLSEGKKVFFVTRGYKGKVKNIVVDLDKYSAEETGDEARLLATVAPTIISPKREYGAKMAVKMGAEVIIMDDGFQNPGLYKDESWLVFDGSVGIGNGRIIPAGPLRETLKNGEKRADYVLIMGKDKTELAKKCSLPVFHGTLEAEEFCLQNKSVLAFAGIGHPEKFYKTLEDLGYSVEVKHNFADHYDYTQDDIDKLCAEAKEKGLELVTTEKDFVKLSNNDRNKVNVLRVNAIWK